MIIKKGEGRKICKEIFRPLLFMMTGLFKEAKIISHSPEKNKGRFPNKFHKFAKISHRTTHLTTFSGKHIKLLMRKQIKVRETNVSNHINPSKSSYLAVGSLQQNLTLFPRQTHRAELHLGIGLGPLHCIVVVVIWRRRP